MLDALRRHIPAKPFLKRTVVDPLRRIKADWQLGRAIDALRAGGRDLKALKRSWSNDGFAGDVRFLEETAARAPGKTVLELGTGLTTILASLRGGTVWSLEQDAAWAGKVVEAMARNRLSARILLAPLVQYDGYAWYDTRSTRLPSHFDLVICDGPYVDVSWEPDTYQAWRYGVLPRLRRLGITIGEMLIDDLDEPRSGPVLERWEREFGLTYEPIRTTVGDCAIARLNA
jgi:hypothetical protein